MDSGSCTSISLLINVLDLSIKKQISAENSILICSSCFLDSLQPSLSDIVNTNARSICIRIAYIVANCAMSTDIRDVELKTLAKLRVTLIGLGINNYYLEFLIR